MNLSKVTLEKITERGWITPEELANAFIPLIQDFDIKLTRGHDLRRDLIMTRIDNFKMELIRRCEKNIELEAKREQSSNLGWFSGETGREQDGRRQSEGEIPAGSEVLGEGSAGLGPGDVLGEASGESQGLDDWTESSGMGRTRPLPKR